MPLASAAYAPDPKPCLNIVLDGAKLIRRFEVPCDSSKNTCSGYTWIDESRKMMGLRKFHNGGEVVEYFNDGFFALWKNGGMGNIVQEMSRQHPDFDLYITGHSLGGSMAAIAAAYIVSSGVHPPNRVILYTFGQPRIGDTQFTKHLGTAVFYENDMEVGAPFVICKGNEDPKCSAKFHVIETNFGEDHVHYFGENILALGQQGCKRTKSTA
ncbi:hypothetical protein PRIPAC_78984 [Pristionchus pacificus]|nr:hypothetical protein PRIPAC_78984 [Pristionchus pacificus]